MQGSSDTTFYIIALYFGSVGITKTRYAVAYGLLADFAAVVGGDRRRVPVLPLSERGRRHDACEYSGLPRSSDRVDRLREVEPLVPGLGLHVGEEDPAVVAAP